MSSAGAGAGDPATGTRADRLAAAVANDSGTGHLIAAAGTKLVSLFGPTRAAKFAPAAPRLEIVAAQDFGGEAMEAIPLDAVDAALIESNVVFGGDGHEGVGRKGFGIDAGGQFPLLPAVIVFGGGETKGRKGFGAGEDFVAPFASKETTEKGVIGLPNHDHWFALLLQDHELVSPRL